MSYSRIVKFVVKNYQAHEHAVLEFGDSNILDIKGANNSGKSALLRAVESLFMDTAAPRAQAKSIRDGHSSYSVEAHFDDGVVVVKEKKDTGSSSWEMLNSAGEVIVSTKTKSGKTTRNRGIPDPIKDYLGMIYYSNGKSTLNNQTANMPAFLSATSGSENYEILNSAFGSTTLEASKLAKQREKETESKINARRTVIESLEQRLGDTPEYVGEFYDRVKALHSELLYSQSVDDNLQSIQNLAYEVGSLSVRPEVEGLDYSDLEALVGAEESLKEYQSSKVRPTVEGIDHSDLELVISAEGQLSELESLSVRPAISPVEGIDLVEAIVNAETSLSDLDSLRTRPVLEPVEGEKSITAVDSALSALEDVIESKKSLAVIRGKITKTNNEVKRLSEEAGVVLCDNCGSPVLTGGNHDD